MPGAGKVKRARPGSARSGGKLGQGALRKQQATGNRSKASLKVLEKESGSAASHDALAQDAREAAKRKTRYERAQTGRRGARSREPHAVN